MSRRIAHRPRPQSMRHLAQSSHRFSKSFLPRRWTYRRFTIPYQKRKLGEGLLQVPFGYQLTYRLILG